MRVIFLVIASQDPVHQADLEVQRLTWASSIPSDSRVIWLRGSESSVAKLSDCTLYVPCLELYTNILEKTILGIRFILENFDFDILIRTNVSTYFDFDRLSRELNRKFYTESFVGGYVDKTNGKYFNSNKSMEYISGTGIFLSKTAAISLSKMDLENFKNFPDDVAISHYLASQNIPLVRMHRNNVASSHLFFPSFFTRTKSSADPSLAGKRMILLHEYFSSGGLLRRIRTSYKIFKLEISAFRNHPEPKIRYIQKNRVVLASFLKTKGWRVWQMLTRF